METPLTAVRIDTPSVPGPAYLANDEPPIVELKNIHKTYLLGLEGVPALRGVSLSVSRGEWVVIYGTSGGGKTSLLNIIGTIDKPTKGELRICGTAITSQTTDDALAALRLAKLGFVFQSFNLISSMTAAENVELPMTLRGAVAASRRKQLVTASLQRVGLGHRLDHFPTQLSGGEQQRVTIARAIANMPEILLLDEPTGDLDTGNTHRAIDLLCKLNAEQHMTMIMVTHDVYLKSFAHRVVYMRDGKVAREERIPAAVRARAIADLQDKLVALGLVQRPLTAQAPSTSTQQSPEQREHGSQPRTGSKTQVRRAADYPTCSPAAYEQAKALRHKMAAMRPEKASVSTEVQRTGRMAAVV